MDKRLYCSFFRKEKVSQGKQASDWLVLIMLTGCGGVSSGLVCLYLKCMLMAESFPVSEDRLTLEEAVPTEPPRCQSTTTHIIDTFI